MSKGKDRFEMVEQKDVDNVLHIIRPVLGSLNTYMNENHPDYVFERRIVGSARRGVVSRIRGGNKGFDIDVNLVIKRPKDAKLNGKDVHTAFLKGLRKAIKGTPFSDPEESSSVFTLKSVDRSNSKIVYGVDLAVIYYEPDGTIRFLQYHKSNGGFGFQKRDLPRNLDDMERIIIDHYGGDDIIAESYIRNKNSNHDNNKHSFIIYVETICNLYHQICNRNDSLNVHTIDVLNMNCKLLTEGISSVGKQRDYGPWGWRTDDDDDWYLDDD